MQMWHWVIGDRKHLRANYLVVLNGFLLLVMAFAIMMTKFANSSEDMYCANNAVPRRQVDGDGAHLCTAQALMLLYTTFAVVAAWFMHILGLFYRVVLGRKEGLSPPECLAFIFIPPLIPVMYNGPIAEAVGFSGSFYPFCTATAAVGYFSYAFFYVPILLMLA
jgi:hypothetical protein